MAQIIKECNSKQMRRFTNYKTLREIFAVTISFIVFFMDGGPLHLGRYLKVEGMYQKTKPHIESLVLGEQNGIWVWGLRRIVSEEFGCKASGVLNG